MVNCCWLRRSSLPVLVFVLFFCFTVSPVFSMTYYVSDSTGNDVQNGTSPSSPWKTLSKVNSIAFEPGDIVLFKRGDIWTKQQLKVTRDGTAAQPIIFSSYGVGERPKFDGVYDSAAFFGVFIVGRSWIVLDGLYIYRFAKGVWIEKSSNNITLTNSRVSHISGECVRLKRDSTSVIIENNVIHDCGQTSNGEGVYVGTDPLQAGGSPDRTTNIIIRNNHVYNTKNEAIELKAGTSNSTIQNNLIHDVRDAAIHTGHWPEPLIIPYHVIYSNRVYRATGNGGYGIVIRSGGINVYNNLIYNTDRYAISVIDNKGTRLTAKVYHNTLYKNSLGGLQVLDNALVDFKNNLLWANGSGNIDSDPLFVDASRGDFRLCEGPSTPASTCSGRSPAIAAGVSLGLPFSGFAPNIGALLQNFSGPANFMPNPSNLRVY